MPKTVAPKRKKAGEPEPTPAQVEEANRIARHEALFYDCTPHARLRQQLIDAMLQRAYDLLWDGDGEACDAITEWLPSDQVRAMLDDWSDDQCGDNDQPKSKWY